MECLSRHFSLEDDVQAKDLLCDMYCAKVNCKMKNRWNTTSKMKVDSIVKDFVNVMVELDLKIIDTDFVVRNILNVPHFDLKDLDPYVQLQRLILLEECIKALEDSQGENKGDLIRQGDTLKKVKQSVETHEVIICSGMLPKPPSYADMASSALISET